MEQEWRSDFKACARNMHMHDVCVLVESRNVKHMHVCVNCACEQCLLPPFSLMGLQNTPLQRVLDHSHLKARRQTPCTGRWDLLLLLVLPNTSCAICGSSIGSCSESKVDGSHKHTETKRTAPEWRSDFKACALYMPIHIVWVLDKFKKVEHMHVCVINACEQCLHPPFSAMGL